MAQHEEATIHYQKCLAIYENSDDSKHPNILQVQSKLAALN